MQMLLGESVVLNGGAVITHDLLVPGTPTVHAHGGATFAGVVEGDGETLPTNYSVTLANESNLRYLRTRSGTSPLPEIQPPQPSAGTRDVTLNIPGANPGDWSTIRDLRLNTLELYDLAQDPCELTDLTAPEKEKAAAMTTAWEKWAKELGVR